MFPLLKTSGDKAASAMPAWHPNFRKPELLPDIKAVRTSFFINGMAVTVVLCLALYLARSEIDLHGLKDQTDYWQQQIDTDKAASDRAVAQFKQFQDEERQLLEAKAFLVTKMVGSELLCRLGERLPPRITLSGVDYRSGVSMTLRGTVSGAPDDAINDASAYVDSLKKDPYFADKIDTATLPTITRNATNDGISFEILVKFKADVATAVKGGAK